MICTVSCGGILCAGGLLEARRHSPGKAPVSAFGLLGYALVNGSVSVNQAQEGDTIWHEAASQILLLPELYDTFLIICPYGACIPLGWGIGLIVKASRAHASVPVLRIKHFPLWTATPCIVLETSQGKSCLGKGRSFNRKECFWSPGKKRFFF